jgi:hypothetical protein
VTHVLNQFPHASSCHSSSTKHLSGVFCCLTSRFGDEPDREDEYYPRRQFNPITRRTASGDRSALQVYSTFRCRTSKVQVLSRGGQIVSVPYIIHLVCHRLEPVLASFYTSNHICQFGADDRLCVKRFPEYIALVRPP